MTLPRVLVVGGNGFLGSSICKAAVAKGWEVSSMSSSGKPYQTPAGHTPKWVDSVTWHRASAFEPETYAPLLTDATAVVHTLGILLEDAGYKQAVRDGNVFGVGRALAGSLFGTPSPLRGEKERRMGYEGMNRDSALTVLDTYLSSSPPSGPSAHPLSSPSPDAGPSKSSTPPRSFVYVSAADCFRPLIPRRYIETKRQAEAAILARCAAHPEAGVHPYFMRPGLMYHPHIRPVSTLPAFLLSLSAGAHDRLRLPNLFSPQSLLGGAAESLRTHPLHVDHVASAVLRCIEHTMSGTGPADGGDTLEGAGADGVVRVETMRRWAGFEGVSARSHETGAGAPI